MTRSNSAKEPKSVGFGACDSPLEEAGFEPSVPRRARGIVVVSVLVRANFSVGRKSSRVEVSPSGNLDRATRYRWNKTRIRNRRAEITHHVEDADEDS